MTNTLYTRLGGDNGIARLVDDIVERHMCNPTIKARFATYDVGSERLETIKRHTRAFLSAGGGGPAEYTGRGMPDAHRGMNISEAEYIAAMDDILDALDAHGMDSETRKDVLAITYSLKGEILRQ